MKAFARPLLRLAGFGIVFLLVLCFVNTFCIKTDAVTAMTVYEMRARDDIELCAVGSSLSLFHFNSALIEQETGKRTFDASVQGANLQGNLAVTRELLRTNRPEWIALVLDTYNLNTAKEDIDAECRLMPHLTGLRERLDYYLRLCREDGLYLDRLLLFRNFGAESLKDVVKTFRVRFDPEAAFAQSMREMPEDVTYMGGGYLRHRTKADVDELVRQKLVRETDLGYTYTLLPSTREMLLDYAALCEQAGVKLMIVIFPALTAHALAEQDFLPYLDSLTAFCAEQGIPCMNFTYARTDFLPRMDGYFYDLHHMNAEGADSFSLAFAELFNRYSAGEDVSGLFYPTREAYLDAIDFITNVWVSPKDGVFTADCNRGAQVAPEYRFALIGPDGGETELRPYAAEPSFACDVPEGCSLRVYARPAGGGEAVWYDYPEDYDAYLGKLEAL